MPSSDRFPHARVADDSAETSLRDRVIVITGGSRGLGAATAQLLGMGGAHVVIADLAAERAQDCAAALAEQDISALALPLDVGEEAQVQALVSTVRERFGRLDAVVNNAAIDITVPIDELAGGMRTPFLTDRFPDIDTSTLQDPANVARAVRFVLTQPAETVVPEVMVLPMKETSWP
jgi:NAD(P)-dependent dehydrogenase (short-subunit alcohol dehydrogenase family)